MDCFAQDLHSFGLGLAQVMKKRQAQMTARIYQDVGSDEDVPTAQKIIKSVVKQLNEELGFLYTDELGSGSVNSVVALCRGEVLGYHPLR